MEPVLNANCMLHAFIVISFTVETTNKIDEKRKPFIFSREHTKLTALT